MPNLAETLRALPQMTVTSVIDILIVAFLIYQFIMIVRGRRAAHVLLGILFLVLVYLAAALLGLELLRSLLATLAPYTVFALIVMFQSEIRRALARLGRRRWSNIGARLRQNEWMDEVVLAVAELSQAKTGALIVAERDIGLRTFIESGVYLDAVVSRDLLLSIFQFGGALHDGAVILQGDRVAAAACFLPLSTNPALFRKLGTRHRAAIGITEESDCMAIVVSEETGWISVAVSGEIELNVTTSRVSERLLEHFSKRNRDRAKTPKPAPPGTAVREAKRS